MRPNQITAALIGLLFLFIVGYDIFSLTMWGPDATISVVVNEWAFKTNPVIVFMAGFVVGGLVIHFLGWAPKQEQVK